MDPSRTHHNVVDLAPRSGSLAHPQAFAEVRSTALRRLGALTAEVLDAADDALFDFVQRSRDSQEQQVFFDAMRELRRQRPSIEHGCRDHIAEAFAALERKRPLKASLTGTDPVQSGLSLVDADQLEEQLATEQVAVLTDRRHGDALRELEGRLSTAAGIALIEPGCNPCGPAHVTLAFRNALQGLDIAIKARLVLYKLFERELGESLGGLLHEGNQRLRQQGVQPAAGAPEARREDAIQRQLIGDRRDSHSSAFVPQSLRHPQPNMRAANVSAGGSQHPTESIDSIFASVRDLCQAVVSARRSTLNSSTGNLVFLPERQALSALRTMQHELPESVLRAVDDPQVSLSILLKQELLHRAERLQLAAPGAELGEGDEQALFLVGLLFDVLLSQRSYDRPVRQQFVRLSVPYARAAMLDQQLFALKTHPARQLLNALAEACDGNHGESAAERDLLGRVSVVVDRLSAEFNEDIAIFSELEAELRAYLDQHRKRVELAEKRAAEAQRGRERLDEARAMAAMELATLIGARELPAALDVFMSRYWTHHLAVVFLREGGSSERYIGARRAGEHLWQTFLACEAGADVPAGMREVLLPVLASSGVSGPNADDVMDAVEWVLLAVRLGRMEAARAHPLPPVMREAVSVDAAEAHAAPVSPVAPMAAPEAAVAAAVVPVQASFDSAALEQIANPPPSAPELAVVAGTEAPGQPQFDPADVQRLQSLEVGAWVEFIDEQGASVPAKLSWVSPISTRLLFVTRRGMRYCAASPQELAVMIREGKLNLRVADSAFENAMSQVLGRLRDSVPGQGHG